MADQGRWFKLWTTAPYDADLGSLSLEDFARWCLFGTYLKTHGTNGIVTLNTPSLPVQDLLRVPSFDALISVVRTFPNCHVTPVTTATVTYKIEWANWQKYQGDFSTDRVRRHRQKTAHGVTPKKRREERRGEEKRREEKKATTSVVPSVNGLPDWLQAVLRVSPNFSGLLDGTHAEFWQQMTTIFDPYEWLAWDEQIRKADAWISDHPQRRPRNTRRFLRNWFDKAVDYGRIQRAKEEAARTGHPTRQP